MNLLSRAWPLAAALALLAVPALPVPVALAQDAAGPAGGGGDSIVVEGERLTEKEARHRAAVFVRTLGVVQGERSVARWTNPICPRVKGLAPDHAALVEGWFRTIAGNAGARLAKGSCRTNLLIAFVDSGEGFMALVKDHRPTALFQVSSPDRRDLVGGDAPIRWWYTIGYGGGDGSRGDGGAVGDVPAVATGGNGQGGGSILPDGVPSGGSISSSLIRTTVIRAIQSATIVVDVNRAEGATLKAVTAFAAFVGLAEVKGTAEPPSASILNLFRDRKEASDLSYWDRAFLDELYTLALNRSGRRQRGRLIKAMVEGDAGAAGDD